MASIPGSVPLTGFIAPTDTADTFAVIDMIYARGGYRVVDDESERNSITQDRRRVGMLVGVKRQINTSPEQFETDQNGNVIIDIYQLGNEPGTTDTTNSDWTFLYSSDTDFGGGSTSGSPGSDGITPISITHTDLVDKRTNSNLEPGAWYEIQDFRTEHKIPYTTDINQGPNEPLLVKALNSNTLYVQAYSTEFPQDIIYYELTPDDASLGADDAPYGWIYRRKDTIHNIDMNEDWRAVEYVRYRIGSNPLGLSPDDKVLWNSSVTLGWDENTSGVNNGELTINADTSTFAYYKPLNNHRDVSSLGYFNIDIDTQNTFANIVYVHDDSEYSESAQEGLYGIDINSTANLLGNALSENSTLAGGVIGKLKTNQLYNSIVYSSNNYNPGSYEAIVDSVITGFNDENYGGPESLNNCSIIKSLFLSFANWNPSDNKNNWEGQISKCVFKHVGDTGIENLHTSFNNNGLTIDEGPIKQSSFIDIAGFHITKLNNTKPYVRSYIRNYPSPGTTSEGYLDYIVNPSAPDTTKDSITKQQLDRIFGKSTFKKVKTIGSSSNTLNLTDEESKIFGIIEIDTSSGDEQIDTISPKPYNKLIIRANESGGSGDVVLTHNTSSAEGIRLPAGLRSSGLLIADNDVDYAEIAEVHGNLVVVNYNTSGTANSSSDVFYENTDPVPQDVGGVTAGTTFPQGTTVQDVFDLLLYPYQYPSIDMSIDSPSTVQEVGNTVSSIEISYSTSEAQNIEDNSVQIYDENNNTLATGKSDTGDPGTVYSISPITLSSYGNHTWTVEATRLDRTGSSAGTISDSQSIVWKWKIYWGTDPTDHPANGTTPDETFIKNLDPANDPNKNDPDLGDSYLANSNNWADVLDHPAGGFRWIAVPTSYDSPLSPSGTPGFQYGSSDLVLFNWANNPTKTYPDGDDDANGNPYLLVTITNSNGVSQDYRLYRSANPLNGSSKTYINF
jgi:hypothetical protein